MQNPVQDKGACVDPQILLEQLIDFERRVRRLYLAYGNRSEFPAEIRFFWNNMAEDERAHAAILQRSAGFLDLIESPPTSLSRHLPTLLRKLHTQKLV